MSTETEPHWAAKIGAPAYSCIAEMVAALECDYERLEELKDERYDLDAEVGNTYGDWQAAISEADGNEEEAEAAHRSAEVKLKEWDDDNREELAELTEAAGECESREDAEQRIQEDALSVEFRSGWESLGSELTPFEFNILLTTGGPAVRIVGELDEHNEPRRAWLEVQDWFKPWTQYFPADQDTLLTYCRCFCFN